jgi:hypothetical protein
MGADIANLVAAANALAVPVAAVEAQWEHDESTSDGWRLDVCVIVEQPGREHARYRSVRLIAPPAALAIETARALAAALGVPVAVTSIAERCGLDGSRWLEAQQPAVADDEVRWEARTWTDDGDRVHQSGTTTWTATSGYQACCSVERAVADDLGAAVRPVDVRARIDDAERWWWHPLGPRSPRIAEVEELRRSHLAGRSVAELVADLCDRAPDVLSVMRLLAETFATPLLDLDPVAQFAAGRIDASALDLAIESVVVDNRRVWDRPRRLRAAHERGESLAAALRAERDAGAGTIELILGLREAFGVSLSVAKTVTDRRNPADDPAVDAELAAAIAGRRL